MSRIKIRFCFFLLMMVAISCDVEEGVGGSATIKGTLILEQYNDDYTALIDSMPAADKRIYIQYGDEKAVSDDVRTSYDGYFEFDYLYEGNYTVFYYSEDSTDNLSSEKEVLVEVNLSKGESKDLGDLKCFETLDYDDGNATIKGYVYEIYFVDNTLIPKDTLMATEQTVYIRYGNHEYYDERIRTQADGSFYFQDLIPGNYTIYVFSEDIRGTEQMREIKKTIDVTENTDTVYTVDNFYIYNL